MPRKLSTVLVMQGYAPLSSRLGQAARAATVNSYREAVGGLTLCQGLLPPFETGPPSRLLPVPPTFTSTGRGRAPCITAITSC
jgi:hypothetical protein